MKIYFLFGLFLALVVPSGFSIESVVEIDPESIPFMGLVLSVPGHLASCSLYFAVMWLTAPVVLLVLHFNPQRGLALSAQPSIGRLVIASVTCILMFALMASTFYLKIDRPSFNVSGEALVLLMATHRLALGIVGGLLMLTTVMTIYLLFILMPKSWLLLLKPSNNHY